MHGLSKIIFRKRLKLHYNMHLYHHEFNAILVIKISGFGFMSLYTVTNKVLQRQDGVQFLLTHNPLSVSRLVDSQHCMGEVLTPWPP